MLLVRPDPSASGIFKGGRIYGGEWARGEVLQQSWRAAILPLLIRFRPQGSGLAWGGC